MKEKRMHETHRINSAALKTYGAITIVLMLAYILEYLKGSRTLAYTLIFALLNLGPYIAFVICYVRDRKSSYSKYILSIGFSVLYSFVLLTAAVPTTFVYIFLIFLIIIPYGDMKLCYITGGIAAAANLISIAIGFRNASLTGGDLAMVEIQLISVAVAAIFTGFATKIISQVNNQKMMELNQEKEKADSLLTHTLEVSRGISEDIEAVSERMKQLDESVSSTKQSMTEVCVGVTETVETMQDQLLQTEEIVRQVNTAESVSHSIAENVSRTQDAIRVGQDNIGNLMLHVTESENAGLSVTGKMNELLENTEKMNSIVEAINSVTRQTSMLSLNASIEAARAGEAGKGFAVVAEEISGLARQTQDATVNITQLIRSITTSINEVFKAMNQLVESNREQNHSAQTMANNFEEIAVCSASIQEVSRQLSEVVSELTRSNENIAQSINVVSEVTQEVSAHAQETLSESEENALVVEEVTGVIININEKAKGLIRE